MKPRHLRGRVYKRTRKDKTQCCFCGSMHPVHTTAASGKDVPPKATAAR